LFELDHHSDVDPFHCAYISNIAKQHHFNNRAVVSLICTLNLKMLNERSLWNALKQAEKKNKILQEEKNSMMEREKDARVSDKLTNTQLRYLLLPIAKYKLTYKKTIK